MWILIDNAHAEFADEFRTIPGVSVVTITDQGLRPNATDDKIVQVFCETHSRTDRLIIATKDRGKKDKIMPKEIEKKRREGYNLTTLTYSANVNASTAQGFGQKLAKYNVSSKSVLRKRGLKNIFVSENFGRTIIRTTDDKGKTKDQPIQ